MFYPFLSIQINACNICICWFIKGANKEVAGDQIYFQRALVEATQDGVQTEIVFLLRLKSLQTLFSVRNMKETVSS